MSVIPAQAGISSSYVIPVFFCHSRASGNLIVMWSFTTKTQRTQRAQRREYHRGSEAQRKKSEVRIRYYIFYGTLSDEYTIKN